jgi:hypothetical protein
MSAIIFLAIQSIRGAPQSNFEHRNQFAERRNQFFLIRGALQSNFEARNQ